MNEVQRRFALDKDLDLQLCRTLIGWDELEQRLRARPVIDFNVCGVSSAVRFDHRYDVLIAFEELAVACDQESFAFERVSAHQSYLRALLGQQIAFADYIRTTQLIRPVRFPNSHIDTTRGDLVRELVAVGVDPDEPVYDQLAELDPPLPLAAAEKIFEAMLEEHRHALAAVVGADLNFDLSIVPVEVDEYWSYWVDGVGEHFRLRLNQRKASFSRAECLQFTFHELLAHCGQVYFWRRLISEGALSKYFGLTTVHTPEQFMFEGLAQVLPLLIPSSASSDQILRTRMHLMRYELLVSNNLHFMINDGASIEDSLGYYEQHSLRRGTPSALNDLASRSTDPLYRSYQYVYPQSCEFFWRASQRLTADASAELVRSCFRGPLTANDLGLLVRSLKGA